MLNIIHRNHLHIYIVIGVFMFLVATPVFAQENSVTYTPMTNIPGIEVGEEGDLVALLNQLYLLLIAIGAAWGVIKIALAGVKYSMSDVVTQKGKAISDIKGVLIGLAILLMPYIVLNQIYPDLTNLDILRNDFGKVVKEIPRETNEGDNTDLSISNYEKIQQIKESLPEPSRVSESIRCTTAQSGFGQLGDYTSMTVGQCQKQMDDNCKSDPSYYRKSIREGNEFICLQELKLTGPGDISGECLGDTQGCEQKCKEWAGEDGQTPIYTHDEMTDSHVCLFESLNKAFFVKN